MKLSDAQITEVERQTGMEPIADDNPALDTLKGHFGDHTFYIDDEGLYVWKRLEGVEQAGQPVTAMQVASWADDEKSGLQLHEPQPTHVVLKIDLPSPANDPKR